MAPGLKNGPVVVCPSCGAGNDLGRVFCTKCGHLLIGGDQAPVLVRKKKDRGGPRPALRNLVLAAFSTWLLSCLVLIAWPFDPFGEVGSDAQAEETDRVIRTIQQSLEAGNAPSAQILTEAGLNAWARRRLPAGRELRVHARATELSAVAVEKNGPLTLSTRYVFQRTRPDEPFALHSFWWGHLPMPKAAADWMTRSLVQRLQLGIPGSVWEGVRLLDADRRRIVVGPLMEPGP